MDILWGVDLGGTKIEGVVFENTEPIKVLHRVRIPTEREKGYGHIINQAAKVVKLLSQETSIQPSAIGIGHPGVLDHSTQTIKNSNSTALNGKPLKKDLGNILQVPLVMANDANCLVIAETKLGIVKEVLPEAQVVFGIIMGTGVGGGLVIDGKIINGKHNIAGEWGHNFLDLSGGQCYCSQEGCVETVISGYATEKYYESLAGKHLKLKKILSLYFDKSDEAAVKTIERLIHFFGKAVATVINVVDPDAIVIGGGLGNIDLLYADGVNVARKYTFNDKLETLFLRPKLGDSAGVFGAALLTAK